MDPTNGNSPHAGAAMDDAQGRRPLGEIFVELGFITQAELDAALAEQLRTGVPLGDILVGQGSLPHLDLATALAEHWERDAYPRNGDAGPKTGAGAPIPEIRAESIGPELRVDDAAAQARISAVEDAISELEARIERKLEANATLEAVPPLTPAAEVRLRRPLGQILVERGFVSKEQLDTALAAQARSGARIGEILMEQGVLTRLDLASALGEQSSPPETSDAPSWTAADRAVIAQLEERLRVIERAAGGAPWQDDLGRVTLDLRAAIGDVEKRLEAPETGAAGTELGAALEAVSGRIEALENTPLRTELEAVRQELEEQKTRPVTVAGLEEIRAAIERLERRPDRADEISQLAEDISGLAARLDHLTGPGELKERLETVAEQTEIAQAGVTGLERRIDELAGLESRLDAVAERVPDASLIDELALRVDEVAASIPAVDPVGLTARIDALEQDGQAGSTALERLAAELRALGGRTEEQLAGLAGRGPDMAPVEELRARIDELASVVARAPDASVLGEVQARLDELAARVVEPDMAPVEELRARLDEVASRIVEPDTAPLDELRARLDEVASRIVEPDMAPVEELRVRLDEVASRIVMPDMAPVEELRARLDEVASRIVMPDMAPLEELRVRLDEVASRIVVPDLAPLDELRARLDEVGSRIVVPDTAPLDELRANVEDLARVVEQAPDASLLAALQTRLDELAGRIIEPNTAPLDELRATVQELAAAAARDETVGMLESRVVELEGTAARTPAKEELRTEVRRLTKSAVDECRSLMQELAGRVDEIATSVPWEAELLELRSRVDELATRPTEDPALRARVGELSARLEGLGHVEGAVADIQASLAALDTVHAEDAAADSARLEDLAGAVDSLAGLESRLRRNFDRNLAGHAEEVSSRLDGAESRLGALTWLDERVVALALEMEQRPDREALAAVAAELRAELAVLEARPVVADPADRLEELSQRIEGTARGGRERIEGVAEELSVRVSGLAEELGHRLDELGERANGLVSRDEAVVSLEELSQRIEGAARGGHERIDGVAQELHVRVTGLAEALGQRLDDLGERANGLVGRDEAEGAAAEHAVWVRSELDALREWATAQTAEAESVVAKADRAHVTGQQQLGHRLDEAVAAIRSDLDAHGSALEGNASETTALHARVAELHQAMSDRAVWEARFESALDERLDALAARVADEIAGSRDDAVQALRAVRDESSSLGARIDELHGMRNTDQAAARAGSEWLAERVELVAELQEDNMEATRAAAQDLSARLETLAAALHAEVAGARAAADELTVRIGELHDVRAGDLAAAELAGAELAARLDEHVVRSAAGALELERTLRDEVDGIAARLEERDASGIEAREELRGELERVASSVGWRLERIEESLASDHTAELQAKVAQLAGRLDEQAALGEEQVRVTERALRKGLASLGERLVDTESAYADAGKALRRSIERLGAAVVEADARMADQVPVSDEEGCVAFAPTPEGYRLIEIPGSPPEIGSSVVLDGCDGPLVITRYGRSPLPLDGRPCAYLDRA